MLFGATPVQTQFSATSNGVFRASGASVADTVVGSTLDVTGLLPDVNPGAASGPSGYLYSNPKSFSITNTGSVTEDLTLTITNVTGIGVPGGVPNWAALGQLEFEMTPTGGSTSYFNLGELPNGGGLPVGPSLVGKTYTFTDVPTSSSHSGFSVVGGKIAVALAPTPSPAPSWWDSNAWMGAKNVSIQYTITATPAAGVTHKAPVLGY